METELHHTNNHMDTKKRKNKTIACLSSSRRRRCQDERRDWGSLPQDVLCIVFGKLPQTDILRSAGLVCSPWRRPAMHEPMLWRSIDLSDGDPWYWKEQPPLGWKAVAHAAVDRSAGRCESFTGHVDADVLVHLASRAPLLRSFHVASWPYITDRELISEIIKKLPLLERLVMRSGFFQEELLVALLDHCPRLELLNATNCYPKFRVWEELLQRGSGKAPSNTS